MSVANTRSLGRGVKVTQCHFNGINTTRSAMRILKIHLSLRIPLGPHIGAGDSYFFDLSKKKFIYNEQ